MEHENSNRHHKVFLSKILYITLFLLWYYSVSIAETICLEDKESGYKCLEVEYVNSIDELSQPMLRKEEIESNPHEKPAITSTEELYNRAKKLNRKLTRESEELNFKE
jgi:hypothetical protein